ncbi:hypothetical protein TVAG_246110 [Trichomonas vaginalis G3]|uniref:Armadillo-like helical domain-containing protein n=1 Tax=Trichomonas vaginalis (strain ATCC PRA-98 / G3) TaxID=412133 RepID=A2E4R7_TRIV3|nr:hypothetical protein TVAGG3_0862730 [Trichomonas vaginalis G3]EAY12377.1 hypothetical protein TVAG_246110 [Trichomonas vaginalis G3]KAI5500795.1 hypothetical protein TVAGG3_0862730 [Trichomonas vaginalis G3]|eukprot:XP_001324600.1 hypothetical protein [Trichomonas vaginalis G3]
MQTKFSALIPELLSNNPQAQNQKAKDAYFWHSFFLLKPEFAVMQNALYSNYSLDAVRDLISRCIDTIADQANDKVAKMKKLNASYLLVQIFESLWPRLRTGTFGVDAINVLCGLQQADRFFDYLFKTILSQRDSESVIVLLSVLVATCDIETNALTDFFIAKVDQIVNFSMQASDLHILFFSLLLQLERPNGPFADRFRQLNPKVLTIFNSLVANLLARCTQLYVCCTHVQTSFFKKVSRPAAAKLGLFIPSDYELPAHFQIFEPFVDAAALTFLELSYLKLDSVCISAAISLFTHIETAPATPHSGDRLHLLLIAFAFLFDNYPESAKLSFDFTQFHSCFNALVTPCVERSIGAMVLECLCFLLNLPNINDRILSIIGRTIYTIMFIFGQIRDFGSANWKNLFTTIFSVMWKYNKEEFNTYMLILVSMVSAYRMALFKRDDGYIELLRALSHNPDVLNCKTKPNDEFQRPDELIAQCKTHAEALANFVREKITPEMTDEQINHEIGQMKNLQIISNETFKMPEKLTEHPKFSQFLRVYERNHCENVQALLQYAIAHP